MAGELSARMFLTRAIIKTKGRRERELVMLVDRVGQNRRERRLDRPVR